MKNTAALKAFATGARTTLIEQMRARVKQLLADHKVAAEYPRELTLLRAALDAHGEHGVAEIAAYTWFNRLTAARYMDANKFSGLYSVVSPEQGSSSALPEILIRAQAGEFPDEVPEHVRAAVTDLLSGRRTSTDPDAEAYGLLLGAVFHTWHQPMPEVFPAAVDWIRLLTPPDILAPTSVRAQAVGVMDDEACRNVEVVGWLYQFYNAELKEQINESKVPIDAEELPAVTQLFTPHWIVRYLVENSLGRLWLRSRPSTGLCQQMPYYVEPVAGQNDTGITVESPEQIQMLDPACGSGHMLTYAFDLLYAIYEEEGYPPSSIPELILTHNLRALEIDERAAQLASFALGMKARDKDRRFFSRGVQPNIVWVRPISFENEVVTQFTAAVEPEKREAVTRLLHSFAEADTFGSLIRVAPDAVDALESAIGRLDTNIDLDMYARHFIDSARILLRQARALVDSQYHVVVANPPYLGSGRMGSRLKGWVETNYPDAKNDLLAAFMTRTTELCVRQGHWGMIVLPSWMFLKTFAAFREWFLDGQQIESFLHLGRGLFGSDFGSVAFTITNAPQPGEYRGVYRRLFEEHVQVRKPEAIEALFHDSQYHRFETLQSDFALIPESPIVYWFSARVLQLYSSGRILGSVGSAAKGLVTADNDRFVRLWFEVNWIDIGLGYANRASAQHSGKRWFPHAKGGDFRRWYGNLESVVDWENDGCALQTTLTVSGDRVRATNFNLERIFKGGFSWTVVGSGKQSFRVTPPGFLFDAAAGIFQTRSGESPLGYLNSTTAQFILDALNPTLNLHPGYLERLPAIEGELGTDYVDELVALFRADWNDYETSWDFKTNPLVAMGSGLLEAHAKARWDDAMANALRAQELEQANNRYFAKLYELEDEVSCDVPLHRISLTQNPYFRYAPNKEGTRTDDEYRALFYRDLAKELISYAVGIMVGRYSLDKPGLILADAGATITAFDAAVPGAGFRPDRDGILPITVEHSWRSTGFCGRFFPVQMWFLL